jgi:hypothetical protein
LDYFSKFDDGKNHGFSGVFGSLEPNPNTIEADLAVARPSEKV